MLREQQGVSEGHFCDGLHDGGFATTNAANAVTATIIDQIDLTMI